MMKAQRKSHQFLQRVTAVLLIMIILTSFINLPAYAAGSSGDCGEKVTWSLEGGNLLISGKGAMTDYSERGFAPWYELRDQIQTVTVSKGVTRIGNLAFYECENLAAVDLADGVSEIGDAAFAECSALTQIKMNGVTYIGNSAFEDCMRLNAVHFSSDLKHIGDRAFYRCSSIQALVIPESATELGRTAFANCTGLLTVTIQAPITVLPYWIFYGCSSLSEISLPSSITTIQDNAMAACPVLSQVEFEGPAEVWDQINESLMDLGPAAASNTKKNVQHVETEDASVTIVQETVESTGEDKNTIQGTVSGKGNEGWKTVKDAAKDLSGSSNTTVDAKIQLTGTPEIKGGMLSDLAGKDVNLTVSTNQNVDWVFAMKDQEESALRKKQDLSVTVVKMESLTDQQREILGDAECYLVHFGKTTLNVTVYIPLGKENSRRNASLYRIVSDGLEALQTVVVNDDGKAAFYLAGTEAGDYIVALDVEGSAEEAIVPKDLYGEYTLMDADGHYYVLTGTNNSLPFTLTQLIIGVVVVMLLAAMVIGIIMHTLNRKKKAKGLRS